VSGWRKVRLDQLGTVERGRSRHRPRNDPSLYGGPYPFVQTGDVKATGLRLWSVEQTYSEEGLAQSRLWPAGTLCITIAANIGETTILGIPACFPDSIVGFTPFDGIADTVFVKYLIDTVKAQLASISRGATQDNLSLEKLLSRDVLVPNLDTQRRIAGILGAYDDLIEVNRRRVAVLEAMARGLFEEWFVRFRFPGNEHHPLQDTPNGPLPEGWRAVALGEVANINHRSLRTNTAPETVAYVDISSVGVGRIDKREVMPFAEAPGRARRCVQDGSIIWSNVRPNRKSYAIIFDPPENLVVSTGFTVIDAAALPWSWLYVAVTGEPFVSYLTNRATGAAYPAVTAATFEDAPILLPPHDLLDRYHATVGPMLRAVDGFLATNERLAAARDMLLPRLISGQIDVGTAERQLETAA
jgi:type I restriction enzyme S subunit